MDEYQYKHIQKYENREGKECANYLGDFQCIDIIKPFINVTIFSIKNSY